MKMTDMKLVMGVLSCVAVVGFVACGGSDEKMSTTGGMGGGSGTATGGTVGTMGGSGGGSTVADLSAFVGGWQYVAGTQNLVCTSIGVNETEQLTGDKYTIAKGVDAPLVWSEPDSKCIWKYNSNGQVMTLLPTQMCMDKFSDETLGTVDVTVTPIASTMTVTGSTATVAFSANYALNIAGSIVNCSVTASGNVMKISN